jgi:ribosomal protein L37AE/L43A
MNDYWYCSECDAVFTDAAGRYLTNRKNLVIPAECELVYVPAVEATAIKNGSYEYWYCPICDAVFADAAGTQLTNRKNLTIPATGLASNDINGDGKVNAVDYLMLKKHIMGTAKLTATQLLHADVNGDGRVNVLDYQLFKTLLMK